MKFDYTKDSAALGLQRLKDYLSKELGITSYIYAVVHESFKDFNLSQYRGIAAVWVSEEDSTSHYINVDLMTAGSPEPDDDVTPMYRIKTHKGFDQAFEIAKLVTKFMGACK